MEVIKKTILQVLTTGVTACTGTTGTCYVIIPDLNAVYHMKLNLSSEVMDIGFFDADYSGYYGSYGEGNEVTFPPIGLNNLI